MAQPWRTCAWLLLIVALWSTACTGGSATEGAEPTPVPETPTPIAEQEQPTADATADTEPTEVPTPAPIEPTAEDYEAAAVAAFEADPPDDLFAWDVLDAEIQGTRGVVNLTICGWDGTTVDDEMLLAAFRVDANETGAATATFESITGTPGECTNTELVESALQTTRDYDNYWSAVLADPASFDPDIAVAFMTTGLVDILSDSTAQDAVDGLSIQNTDFDGALPDSVIQDLLTRVYVDSDDAVVREVLACRELPETYGLYRGDVLVDDFQSEQIAGNGGLLWYRLVRAERGWLVAGTERRLWVDCSGTAESWLAAVNGSLGEPTEWTWLDLE